MNGFQKITSILGNSIFSVSFMCCCYFFFYFSCLLLGVSVKSNYTLYTHISKKNKIKIKKKPLHFGIPFWFFCWPQIGTVQSHREWTDHKCCCRVFRTVNYQHLFENNSSAKHDFFAHLKGNASYGWYTDIKDTYSRYLWINLRNVFSVKICVDKCIPLLFYFSTT